MLTLARLQIRQMISSRKLALGAFLVMPVLICLLFAMKIGGGAGDFDAYLVKTIILFILFPSLTCGLLALLQGGNLLGQEYETRTIVYLYTRPLGKWRIVCAKYLGVVGCLIAGVTVSTAVGWVLLSAPGGGMGLMALWVAGIFACGAYTAIFLAISMVVPQRVMSIGLVYGFLFEVLLSSIPAVVKYATVQHHLRTLIKQINGISLNGMPNWQWLHESLGDTSAGGALLGLGIITGVALLFSILVATHKEYRSSDQTTQ
jgi:ABC-type transport system involved in multi-copper enzyme maturation permease subunit